MVIVAAVDRSERASDVVAEAESLGKAFDETVHVLHVLSQSEFIEMGRTAAENHDESFSMETVEETAAAVAAEAASELTVPSESIGRMGEPAQSVITYANDQDASYVVVGARKRSPTGKVIFGSVAQSILLNADCPVLVTVEQ